MMLEWSIGVQMIDFCESPFESQPRATAPAMNTKAFPIQNLDAKVPFILEPK
jgi:hypothetical protein